MLKMIFSSITSFPYPLPLVVPSVACPQRQTCPWLPWRPAGAFLKHRSEIIIEYESKILEKESFFMAIKS
jgi:hypothetical protein